MSVNKVILLGRVGKDPEIKDVNGKKVASFSLATSEKYKDKSGEVKESTEWTNIVIWDKLAEVVEKYVKKGDMLYVEGKLKTRSWDSDGVKKYATDVVVNTMQMIGSKQGQSSQDAEPAFGVDNLPF